VCCGEQRAPSISPDGKRVAVDTDDDGKNADVWIYDLDGRISTRRLTFGGANRFPTWSADGMRVTFRSDREHDFAVFWQLADRTGTAERLTKPARSEAHVPEAGSPDGKSLLFDAI